ncbi:MAG: growth inhibitor PemK [Corynebacterium sp.]|nr:growth inhibitor PemK [Corynebacterium sp.]
MKLRRQESGHGTIPLRLSSTQPKKQKHWFGKVVDTFRRDHAGTLDEGLDMLYSRLGLHGPEPTKTPQALTCDFTVCTSDSLPRTIFYAPNMDGQVDPGEVVWFWIPSEDSAHTDDESTLKFTERALVVVGRTGDHVLGLITSPNPEHAHDEKWLDIGAGPWDDEGRQSWLRLDKVIKVAESTIRRQGAFIPPRRFNRIASRLRNEYGWN